MNTGITLLLIRALYIQLKNNMKIRFLLILFTLISTSVYSIEILNCSGKLFQSYFSDEIDNVEMYVNVDLKKNKVIFSKSILIKQLPAIGKSNKESKEVKSQYFKESLFAYDIDKVTDNFIFLKSKDVKEGTSIIFKQNDKGEIKGIDVDESDYLTGVIDKNKLTLKVQNSRFEESKYKKKYDLNCELVRNKI